MPSDLEALEGAPLHISQGDVLRICSLVEDQPHIIVGGQALNFWGEHYATKVPALAHYRPYTSRDIDFFGRRELAHFLAERLGGEVLVPEPEDATPSAAIVTAKIGAQAIVIDVLASVLGIATRELVRGQVELELPVSTDFGDKRVGLVLMHPLHCFVSRAVTVYHPAIRRRDGLAMRQLRASTWILAAFLDELANIDVRETGRWLVALGHTLAKHEWVRQIDVATDLDLDPLEILFSFYEDQRLDIRFRNSQIAGWIAKVRRIRTVFAKKHVRSV